MVREGLQADMGSELDCESQVGFREAGEAVGSVNNPRKRHGSSTQHRVHSKEGLWELWRWKVRQTPAGASCLCWEGRWTAVIN